MIEDLSEKRRLEGIAALVPLTIDSADGLQRIARVAARITGSPFAAIHIIDADTQHRVAAFNAPLEDQPREFSMCRVVIDIGAGLAVADAAADIRFAHTTMGGSGPPVRYYAGAPLDTDLYGPLGTVCVWDTEPHDETGWDVEVLQELAALAVDRLRANRLIRVLKEESRTDELTGLPNRRMIHDRVREALGRRQRQGDDVVVAYVDLNGFKAINDAHGHQVGDQVLVHVAQQLTAVTRADEVVARLGGDEFLIVGTAGMHTQKAISRFAAALGRPAQTDTGEVHVNASFGLATAVDGDDSMSLIRRADGEMFSVKRSSASRRPD